MKKAHSADYKRAKLGELYCKNSMKISYQDFSEQNYQGYQYDQGIVKMCLNVPKALTHSWNHFSKFYIKNHQ